MTDRGHVILAIEGAVATICFDRPAARNAMTFAMYDELDRVLEAVVDQSEVRVAVLRGAGSTFVAGTDISEFTVFANGADGLAYEKRVEQSLARIENLPIPTLAVIEGAAMGGGLMIAACCDLRIATADSRFGVPVARTVGNCLSRRNISRLERGLGLDRTRRILLLAQSLNAAEAARCGFILDAVAPDGLNAAADAILQTLLANAPLTIKATRLALRSPHEAEPADAETIREIYGSHDFAEGVSAFLAKRRPEWMGR